MNPTIWMNLVALQLVLPHMCQGPRGLCPSNKQTQIKGFKKKKKKDRKRKLCMFHPSSIFSDNFSTLAQNWALTFQLIRYLQLA